MTRFTLATLGMVALLIAAMTLGGAWPVLALAGITVGVFALDRIALLSAPDRPAQEGADGDALSVVLGIAHFPLLYAGTAQIATDGPVAGRVALFVALSLFLGQVSNSNAHMLIHRAGRWHRRLGVAVYSSLLFGHHVSAHLRVHHKYVATARDPNSAPLGQSFYGFAPRAWIGSFQMGLRADNALRARGGKQGAHPYMTYFAGAALSLLIAARIAGGAGLCALLGLCVYAQTQLLLSDYVQHYGLRRRATGTGRLEPVGPRHSWNTPHGASSALMLNAPRHSDHHAHPLRPYPDLALDRGGMPMLPHALPVMAVIALLPPAWRRMMDARAQSWQRRSAPPAGAPGHIAPTCGDDTAP
ncbi:alkane 1-monooxygenase [Salipiger aestuarii]|uniref:alkane 1-monooxygenase n=1 Tax=Salipiger aestuarii TaxID=568098 RepID=UPI00025B7963|nr:alkane 1-monooxygenase [Salipiger aestuarii]EIE50990.1 alkane-1 monooxygenase, putative [Citreicella sp. 357]KAA8607382.1 alkane 1-monooxygenase [Salipiger aestuarii]